MTHPKRSSHPSAWTAADSGHALASAATRSFRPRAFAAVAALARAWPSRRPSRPRVWIAAAFAALSLTACQTAKPTPTVPIVNNVYTADSDVDSVFEPVSYVQRVGSNGLLETQLQIRNKTDRPRLLYYQAEWFDDQKFKLGVSRWRSELIQAGEVTAIPINAQNPRAAYSNLLLKL